jgi:hypothetical protein
MAWPMIEWVLDTCYADASTATAVGRGGDPGLERPRERADAADAENRGGVPGLKVFSLPFLGSADVGRHIELGVRGAPEQVPAAMDLMRREVRAWATTSPRKNDRGVKFAAI